MALIEDLVALTEAVLEDGGAFKDVVEAIRSETEEGLLTSARAAERCLALLPCNRLAVEMLARWQAIRNHTEDPNASFTGQPYVDGTHGRVVACTECQGEVSLQVAYFDKYNDPFEKGGSYVHRACVSEERDAEVEGEGLFLRSKT